MTEPDRSNGTATIPRAAAMDRLGASVYELPPGWTVFPYHYESSEERWLAVSGAARPCGPPTRTTTCVGDRSGDRILRREPNLEYSDGE